MLYKPLKMGNLKIHQTSHNSGKETKVLLSRLTAGCFLFRVQISVQTISLEIVNDWSGQRQLLLCSSNQKFITRTWQHLSVLDFCIITCSFFAEMANTKNYCNLDKVLSPTEQVWPLILYHIQSIDCCICSCLLVVLNTSMCKQTLHFSPSSLSSGFYCPTFFRLKKEERMGVKCLTPLSKLNVFLVHFARLAELKVTPANLLIHQAMHVLELRERIG